MNNWKRSSMEARIVIDKSVLYTQRVTRSNDAVRIEAIGI